MYKRQAQAWHWFDHSRFNRELLRVLRPGGVFAAWGYGWFSIDAQIDAAIDEEYLRPIGPYLSLIHISARLPGSARRG